MMVEADLELARRELILAENGFDVRCPEKTSH